MHVIFIVFTLRLEAISVQTKIIFSITIYDKVMVQIANGVKGTANIEVDRFHLFTSKYP